MTDAKLDLLKLIGWTPPEGTTITEGHRLGWKAVRPDLTTTHGYRWPWPGNIAKPHPTDREMTTTGECPRFEGDGLCLALDFAGAASGSIPAITILVVSFDPSHVLFEDTSKMRVSECAVVDVVDLPAKIRSEAVLTRAYLSRADLSGADLSGAYLYGADLTRADLSRADLSRAYLSRADLSGANLSRANGDNSTRLPAGWKVNDSGLIVAVES